MGTEYDARIGVGNGSRRRRYRAEDLRDYREMPQDEEEKEDSERGFSGGQTAADKVGLD